MHIQLIFILVAITFVTALRYCAKVRAKRHRRKMAACPRKFDSCDQSRIKPWSFLRHILDASISLRRYRNTTHATDWPITHSKRLRAAIACIYPVSNIACCLAIPNQPHAQRLAAFRGRYSTFVTFNLILTMLFALWNNPLIWLLHTSYDTFNFFHRWTARLFLLQSLVHVFVFVINTYHVVYNEQAGWQSIEWVFEHSLSYQCELTHLIAFTLITVLFINPLCHALYETFLSLHRLGAVIAIAGLYVHSSQHALPQLSWISLAIGLLAVEYFVRILPANFRWRGQTWTQVTIEALPGETTRVTFALPRT